MFRIARLCESEVTSKASRSRLGESGPAISVNQVSAVEAQNKAVFGTNVVPRNHSLRFRPLRPRCGGLCRCPKNTSSPHLSGLYRSKGLLRDC